MAKQTVGFLIKANPYVCDAEKDNQPATGDI